MLEIEKAFFIHIDKIIKDIALLSIGKELMKPNGSWLMIHLNLITKLTDRITTEALHWSGLYMLDIEAEILISFPIMTHV